MTFLDPTNARLSFGQNLLQSGAQPARTIGSGLQSIGSSLFGALLTRRGLAEQRKQNQDLANSLAGLLQPDRAATTSAALAAGGGPTPAAASIMPGDDPLASLLRDNPNLAPRLAPTILSQVLSRGGGERFAPVEDPTKFGFREGDVVQRNLNTGAFEVLRKADQPRAPGRPVQVFDPSSPSGIRLVSPQEAIGRAGPQPSSTVIESFTNPDGTQGFRFVRGRGAGSGQESTVTKATQSKLEQAITQGTTQLDRLTQIRQNFNPEFLNLPSQLFTRGAAAAERLGFELGPETKKQVQEFTAFRTSTLRNMNRILNELSGAAISPAEAKRLMAELPTTQDSPTEFMAKLQSAEQSIQAALARNQQLLQGGVTELRFGDNGEILNAPSLEEFMLRQQEEGEMRQAAAPQGGPTAAQVAPTPVPEGTDFSTFGANDILNLNSGQLTPEQRDAVIRRMDELGL